MTNALTVLATSSTDLATTLNLRPGFADSVVDYDYDMTKAANRSVPSRKICR